MQVDERGWINEVAEGWFRSVQMIFSKKGAVRSNHWHKKGGHTLYVVSGRLRYWERSLDCRTEASTMLVGGDSVLTHPEMIHRCEFLEDTTMICCATLARDRESYEEDTVRVP